MNAHPCPYRAAIVNAAVRETIPRRAYDRANQLGWTRHLIPVMPRRGRGYRTESAAVAAMTRITRRAPRRDWNQWRGLVWLCGRENDEATTVAI